MVADASFRKKKEKKATVAYANQYEVKCTFEIILNCRIVRVKWLITCRAKLLKADWLRQRAFFLNQEGTFGNQEGMIT